MEVSCDIFNLFKNNKLNIPKFNKSIEDEFNSKAILKSQKNTDRPQIPDGPVFYKNILFKTDKNKTKSLYKILLKLF